MPTLSISKEVSYTDPATDTVYSLPAKIIIEATQCYRDQFVLSASAEKIIFDVTLDAMFSNTPKWAHIKNVGANSAYIGIYTNGYSIVEIPAGCDHDFFGKDIFNSDSGISTIMQRFDAKGDTTIEVDVFM